MACTEIDKCYILQSEKKYCTYDDEMLSTTATGIKCLGATINGQYFKPQYFGHLLSTRFFIIIDRNAEIFPQNHTTPNKQLFIMKAPGEGVSL